MSANLDISTEAIKPSVRSRIKIAALVGGEPLWVMFCMFGLSLSVVIVAMKLFPVIATVSKTTGGQLTLNAIIYALALGFVVLPLIMRRRPWADLRQLVGVNIPPTMRSVSWAMAAFGIYFISTVVVGAIAVHIPGYDIQQPQKVGYEDVSTTGGYVMAFVGLVVLPPVFEELLFRGYLFGRLRKWVSFWPAAIVTSLAFGFVHGQWNVGLDTFVLSLFLSFLRESTGSLWASMILHGIKNGLAYFFLFIAPIIGLNLI